jgi:hypothetical protein
MSNNTLLSPYGAAKLVNAALKEAGLSTVIPPQMMYNYTTARVNAGKAPFIKWDAKTGVDRDDLERWTKAYVAKKVAAATVTTEA